MRVCGRFSSLLAAAAAAAANNHSKRGDIAVIGSAGRQVLAAAEIMGSQDEVVDTDEVTTNNTHVDCRQGNEYDASRYVTLHFVLPGWRNLCRHNVKIIYCEETILPDLIQNS